MGLKVTTDDKGIKVYRNDKTSKNGTPFTTYSIMVSTKKDDDYVNAFIDVMFPKGTDIQNKSLIKINDAWFMASEYNEKKYTKLYIKDYDLLEGGHSIGDGFVPAPDDLNINVPEGIDEDLPFTR